MERRMIEKNAKALEMIPRLSHTGVEMKLVSR